jgi:hypothetical protein
MIHHPSENALRFVLHHHSGWLNHANHYDLMLQKSYGADENSAVLATFSTQINQEPSGQGELFRVNEDHRLAYLTLEGALSQNRGTIRRVDSGLLFWLDTRFRSFRLEGLTLKGSFDLEDCEYGQTNPCSKPLVTFVKWRRKVD